MLLTSTQLAALTTPAGWVWHTRPTIRVTGRIQLDPAQRLTSKNFSERLTGLYEWALKNDIGLTGIAGRYAYVSINYDDYAVFSDFKVHSNKAILTKTTFGKTEDRKCPSCERVHAIGALRCDNAQCMRRLNCQGCSITGLPLHTVSSVRGNRINLCGTCAPLCKTSGCEHRIYAAEYAGSRYAEFAGKCQECAPVGTCFACSKVHPKDKMKKVLYRGEERQACESCYDAYVCPVCTSYKKSSLTEIAGKVMCRACASVEIDKSRIKYEKFDKDELPVHGSMLVESLPERPFRLVSIETEVDGDKDILAGTLFRCGIVRTPEVESYQSYSSNTTHWAAHLKHDGSVSGGELISHCIQLDDPKHADVFLDVLKKLKSLQTLGKVEYNANCGGHIHIDAHNFGFGDVWRLLTVWNYLEDVIYRLAGSGAKYSHRTLVPDHSRANGGRGYANSPIKGPFGNKGVVGESLRAQQRMSGLNFVPYLGAIEGCACGAFARQGDGRGCTCNLGKATIEWRVWNSTGNPRILHAWIAFMQAMHAYADQGVDPTAEWEKEFPAFAYTYTPIKSCTQAHLETSFERLTWIFRNLVLTNNERDSLVYTIKQSELKVLGESKINTLLDIVPVGAFPIKSIPRNPAKRTTAIVVAAPKAGKDKVTAVQTAADEMRRVMYNDIVGARR